MNVKEPGARGLTGGQALLVTPACPRQTLTQTLRRPTAPSPAGQLATPQGAWALEGCHRGSSPGPGPRPTSQHPRPRSKHSTCSLSPAEESGFTWYLAPWPLSWEGPSPQAGPSLQDTTSPAAPGPPHPEQLPVQDSASQTCMHSAPRAAPAAFPSAAVGVGTGRDA